MTPNWTVDEYAAYLRKISGAKPEPAIQHEAARQDARKEDGAGRAHVRITSYRVRCCDIDNITGGAKFLIDGLRYAGVIRDNRPEDIALEVRQEKVARREDEGTMIEITFNVGGGESIENDSKPASLLEETAHSNL